MTNNRSLSTSIGAGALIGEETHRSLLESIAEVARAIFGARASTIFILDEETNELVFEAIAGYGSETLVGKRFRSSTGIAGWVLVMRQPLVLEDVSEDPRFSRDVAESTGYVPRGMMAVPLLHDDRALGVLEVLDPAEARLTLEEAELLALFAKQAAIALDLLRSARHAKAVLGEDEEAIGRLASVLELLQGEKREAGLRLLASLEELVTT